MKSHFWFIAITVATTFISSPAAAQLYWDIDGTTDGAGGMAPSGMWDGATTNWNTDPTGGESGVITSWDGTSATFSAGSDAAGNYSITVDGTQFVNGIIFDSGSPTLNGGQLSLTGSPNTIQVDASVVATINSVLQGTGLTKTGDGTLVLGGDNNIFAGATLTGVININGGMVVIPSGAPAGVLGDTVNNTNSGVLANGNTAVNDGATLSIGGTYESPDMLYLAGDGVGGGGALRKTGDNNTVQKGGIRIRGTADHARITSTEGTLWLASTGAQSMQREFGPAQRDVIFDGAGNISTTSAGMVVDSVSYSNFNIALSTSRVIKEGAGTLTLNSISSYNGGTIIREGVVAFNADGITGGTSYNLGAYPSSFDDDNITLDGGTLRSKNISNGSNFISPNRGIQLGPNGGTVDVPTNVSSTGGTLALLYASGDTSTVVGSGGRISMTPSTTEATLTKVGPGEFRVSGSGTAFNTFTQLVVKQGLYRIGSVTTNGVQQSTETGFGAVPASFKPDAIVLDGGAIGASLGITLDANRGITLGASGGSFNVSAGSIVVPGAITGVGALKKDTAGTLTLRGANDYSGGTAVSLGTLVVGTAPATLGTGDVTISGGTLQISSGVANAIADTAALIVTGGILNLGTGIDEMIASLSLGGVPQVGGTYGSTSSGATFQNDTYFAGSGILTIPGGMLPGDYNNDGKVNAADYVLWRKDPGNHGGPGGYNIWRANFGDPPGAGSGSGLSGGGSVPEPAAVALLLSAVGVLVGGFRRRR
jgi:autotransporter-associated beta strand protein